MAKPGFWSERRRICASRSPIIQLSGRSRGARHSPIAGIVLTSADVDGIAGLLVLREQQPLRIYAAAPLLRILGDNRLFDVLDPSLVQRIEIAPNQPFDAGSGLSVELLEMPGKIPLYHEDRSAKVAQAGATYAARIAAGGRSVTIASACAEVTDEVLARLAGTDALFFDGTVFSDDEMAKAGVGTKTGAQDGPRSDRRRGRVPWHGSRAWPAQKIYFHINNTNPILIEGSPERALVEASGFAIAHDGMEITV